MRLRTFQADSIGEAMQMVRDALGDDAIIVSTHESGRGRGVQITAAVEDPDEVAERQPEPLKVTPAVLDVLRDALSFHGVPDRIARRLGLAAEHAGDVPVTEALAVALDRYYEFTSLARAQKPLLLVGPPGAGKTTALAKLAAQAVMARRQVQLLTTDTVRAGAVAQLAGYARVMKQPLQTVDSPAQLAVGVRAAARDAMVLIDTPATSPFGEREMGDLKRFIKAVNVEPVLVLPAGMDALETAETAAAFASLGCRSLIVMRLDAVRRYGCIPAALEGGSLMLAAVSHSPSVAQALVPVNPVSLARIFTCDPEQGSELSRVGAKST